jgi:hypothetical protein
MSDRHLPTMAWDADHAGFTVMGEYVEMGKIPKMYNAWLEEVKRTLDDMCPGVSLPSRLRDNLQDDTPGYSAFDCNPRLLSDHYRLALCQVLTPEYVLGYEDQRPLWNSAKATEYMRKSHRLNVLLLLLLHIGSGSPARSTEILSMLFRNGQNSRRGLFVYGDGLMWMVSYNKVWSPFPIWLSALSDRFLNFF